MSTKDIRFGVNLNSTGGRAAWQTTARHAEELGYDVLLAPDHLGRLTPLPALVSVAAVTSRAKLGTFVLNTGFYRPALLARDVAGLHELTDGRFELGLGAGYVAEEFEAAGLPFPSARQRVEQLEQTVSEVGKALSEAGHRVPVMIAGQGDRLLSVAARHADIINLSLSTSATPEKPDPLAGRIELIRRVAGDRIADIELSLVLPMVHIGGVDDIDLSLLRRIHPGLSDAEILCLPGVVHGTAADIADTLRHYRDTYGITYFVTMGIGENLTSLGRVISEFR
ncbi:TIGR03621 family F420-dependent LLM class oxidoreductase [Nocardia colli]|uniref:TIGR03621 family F420-dependent LLM class oxidoreductase n=1 Tax=Nocardia colli TaxID=2545717 RepID=A0A5N0E2X1_9NOCA|nr:TIGR03621 family F420-dependent LLM class oxidoreductase [Nocardia colli]KAA8882071.1 TIGR03621 family F420-dependent LLM class oxidoreductase [Nocardia colli]